MRRLFYITAFLLAAVAGLAIIGRQAEQNVAERQHYDKVRTTTDELQKFTGQKQ